MCAKVKCPACGYENVQQGRLPESLRCGYCGNAVFTEAGMQAVDKMLREMGKRRRDAAFLENYHE